MTEKTVKVRQVQCYHCSKQFDRNKIQRMNNGDALICDGCRYYRNKKRVTATAKLKKRNF